MLRQIVKLILILSLIILSFYIYKKYSINSVNQTIFENNSMTNFVNKLPLNVTQYLVLEENKLTEAAKKQIGVVKSYDTSYYVGGYPPEDRGACTDVIDRALLDLGYNLKEKIDFHMKQNPNIYKTKYDENINFRRVVNLKTFLEYNAQSLDTCTNSKCLNQILWKPGDIVTFDQIPGSLWHIAFISNRYEVKSDGSYVPLLIHNYGFGVVEDNMLLVWPTKITGHYRIDNILEDASN